MAYESQLVLKRHHVLKAMAFLGGAQFLEALVADTVPSPLQYKYRRKVTPHLQMPPSKGSRPRRLERASKGWVSSALERQSRSDDRDGWGFLAQGPLGFIEQVAQYRNLSGQWWKRVVDVDHCPVATDEINAALPGARAHVRKRGGPFSLLLRHTEQNGVVTDRRRIVLEHVEGVGTFSFRAGGFFQSNLSILPQLVGHVVTEATASMSNDTCGPDVLIDTYCGVGLFGIACHTHVQSVIGVEADTIAVELAKANAIANGAVNIEFWDVAAEAGFERLAHKVNSSRMSIIIDPPRAGLTDGALRSLLLLRPDRITYVSCDYKTQARDLHSITRAGYNVTKITPFDLFPQSNHLEVVAVLERAAGANCVFDVKQPD